MAALWLDARGRLLAQNGAASALGEVLPKRGHPPGEGCWGPVLRSVRPLLDHPACDDREGHALELHLPSCQLELRMHGVREERERYFLLLIEDLTAARKRAADLRIAQRVRELRELQSRIVHDVRSPMGSISMNLELFVQELEGLAADTGDLGWRSRHLVELVQREMRRLDGLLTELLRETALLLRDEG